jgi:putative SOS response-associated peptidase YedK
LWDLWRAPDGQALKSFAIITTAANDLLEPLHDRMPVLLTPDRWTGRLGRRLPPAPSSKVMLTPLPGAGMAFWPADRRVGDVHNDNPDLFKPVANPVGAAR